MPRNTQCPEIPELRVAPPVYESKVDHIRLSLAAGLVAACLLWTLPQLRPVPPTLSGLLFAVSSIAAAAAVIECGLALVQRRPVPMARRGVSVLLIAAAIVFVADLFLIRDRILVDASPARSTVPRTSVPRSTAPAARKLRIVSLNVLHGWPRFDDLAARTDALEQALHALHPDVVALQEAWRIRGHGDLAARLGAALGMQVVYARANGSLARLGFEEGCAVLSRFPIVSAERLVLRPRWPWWESRIAVRVDIDLGDERATVVSAHLSYLSLETATAQARDLRARLGQATALRIVAGDFNAPSSSAAVQSFVDSGWRDLITGGIDHVLLAPGTSWTVGAADWTLRPEDLNTLIGRAVMISDHPGIVVDLVPPDVVPESPAGSGGSPSP